jgi:predicted transposase
MKRVAAVKLAAGPEQQTALVRTLEAFNAACEWIASVAFADGTANKFKLQKLVYRETRERFGLPTRMAVRVIAKVCEAFKRNKRIQSHFRPYGAMTYDECIYAFIRQLRAFVEYKARLAGVKVVLTDPRNTSRTCPGVRLY